jgi:malonyl-CoA O-methyltransferase
VSGGTSIRGIAASELLERIRYFELDPERILLLGHRREVAAATLRSQFARAELISIDTGPSFGDATGTGTASSTHLRRWWPARRVRQAMPPPLTMRARSTALPLKHGLADLSYINLLLPACPEPDLALREIARTMRPGALLLFASLGADSLPELSGLSGSPPPGGTYPNIAQLGELLLRCGFAEPVIDVERHQIRYESASSLRAELQQLEVGSAAGSGEPTLTFELIVAAAFAASPDRAPGPNTGDIAVPVESIRRRKR